MKRFWTEKTKNDQYRAIKGISFGDLRIEPGEEFAGSVLPEGVAGQLLEAGAIEEVQEVEE